VEEKRKAAQRLHNQHFKMSKTESLDLSGPGCLCLRRLAAEIGAVLIFIVISFIAQSASAATKGYCEFILDQGPAAADDPGFMTFDGTPYYNGGLLLEFFGPHKNSLPDWLKWLESDDSSLPEPKGPGLYVGGNSFVLAKKVEFPIDGGLLEFGNDPSRKMIVSLMEFRGEGIKSMRGSSSEAKAAREKFLQRLDLQLFGLYGAVKADTYANLLMRSIAQDHLLFSSRSFRRDVKTSFNPMGVQPSVPPSNPVEDMKAVAEVVHEDSDNVLVRIDLSQKPANRNQEIIQKMFFITHWQMVQKAYRESRLFEDKLETSLMLLDDFVKSMEETKNNEQIFLMYSAQAWHTMVYRMTAAHKYYSTYMSGIGMQPYRYQRIADVFYPFYPTYGMIVEKFGENEFEMKRLFHNQNPDPLNYLRAESSKIHKYFFYNEVGKTLPEGAKLMAVSKNPIHTRLYKSIGFNLVESKFYAPWNCTKDVLRMTLDEYLAKTKPE
jgi:hypothetical protein